MSFLDSSFLWLKALHVIFVIAWMAGIFYLPRLFVRHAENQDNIDISNILKLMEHKLYRIIMNPAMMISWTMGLLMLGSGTVEMESGWFIIKFIAVCLMTFFHIWCGVMVRVFAQDENKRSSRYFRMMNEIPTVLMMIIVIMVIVRPL